VLDSGRRPFATAADFVPGPFRDLGYQAGLTALLNRARPGDLVRPDDWAAEIGDLLGAPLALSSFGPTAAGKRVSALTGVL
jgi:adenylosuccinate synthase